MIKENGKKLVNVDEKFYVPIMLHPHNFGIKFGSYLLTAFSTLDELRRWYPEPQKYIILVNGDDGDD